MKITNNMPEEQRIELIKEKYIGRTEGKLTIIDFDHKFGKMYFFKCRCNECGREVVLQIGDILQYKSSNKCNCKRELSINPGDVKGVLEVLEFVENKGNGKIFYKCRCNECGWEGVLRSDMIKKGKTSKCNCNSSILHPGDVKGVLEVLEEGVSIEGRRHYKCLCTLCGWIGLVRKDSITEYGRTSKCYCSIPKGEGKTDLERVSEDLTDQVFGDLTVEGLAYIDESHNSVWKCKCKCGRYTEVTRDNLKSGNTKRCYYCGRESAAKKNTIDITNQIFGNCIALEIDEEITKRKSSNGKIWKCKCFICGATFNAVVSALTKDKVTCCPTCAKRRSSTVVSDQRLYNIYRGMIARCYDPSHISYKYYGGNDPQITVCDRWRESYYNFAEDMYDSFIEHEYYNDSTTLDRINVYEGYNPDNCRWATTEEQALNKSNNVRYQLTGYENPMTLNEMVINNIADRGVDAPTIKRKMDIGFPLEEAIKSNERLHAHKMITFEKEPFSVPLTPIEEIIRSSN